MSFYNESKVSFNESQKLCKLLRKYFHLIIQTFRFHVSDSFLVCISVKMCFDDDVRQTQTDFWTKTCGKQLHLQIFS